MPSKTEERRAKLRETLIDIAERDIARGGLAALKARDLAKEAGCAVGAIYTHFSDMHALSMAVNARTFRRLGTAVTQAVRTQHIDDPHEQMIVMSHAYLAFAADNMRLWRALFDLEVSSETAVPDWYLAELRAVFALIAAPLSKIFPDREPDALNITVRALFSAVHGIVLLGLERRISAVPMSQIEQMIREILQSVGK